MSENERELLANITPFGLRMQPGLKERVAEAARKNNRSLNSEIVERLEASLGPANPSFKTELARARLKRAVAEMKEAIAEVELAEGVMS